MWAWYSFILLGAVTVKVTALVLVVGPTDTGLTDVGLQVRIRPGLKPTPGALSRIFAVRCQRSGLTVSVCVRRQLRVTVLLLAGIISRTSRAVDGNSGNGCGSGMCSRPSWTKP